MWVNVYNMNVYTKKKIIERTRLQFKMIITSNENNYRRV